MNVLACKLQFQEKDMLPGVSFVNHQNKGDLKPHLDIDKCLEQMNGVSPQDIRFHGKLK